MGRRKERKSSGRRMILDLIHEPSLTGDLEDSSLNEDGGGPHQKTRAGIPNSPSSSGQHQDNPLLLLGQYSDDDVNEEANERLKDTIEDSFPVTTHGQVDEPFEKELEKLEEQLKEIEQKEESAALITSSDFIACDIAEGRVTIADDSNKEDLVAQPYGSQVTDEISGWKIVMHEESNRYYYWNTETGETSWEVPNVLAHEVVNEQEALPYIVESLTTEAGPTVTITESGGNLNCEVDMKSGELQMKSSNEGQIDGDHEVLNSAVHVFKDGCHEEKDNNVISNEDGFGTKPCFNLLSYGERLLHSLKELERPSEQSQIDDLIAKYILEVKVRLSDIKSLLAYGSSLLPFWMHCEEKLKGIEQFIDDRVSHFTKSNGSLNEVKTEVRTDDILVDSGDNTSQRNGEEKPELNVEGEVILPSQSLRSMTDMWNACRESTSADDTVRDIVPSTSPTQGIVNTAKEDIQEVLRPDTDEDVDMDVDMEVDDDTTDYIASRDILNAENISSMEHMIDPNPPLPEGSSFAENDSSIPPPPTDDWIPPPPPDDDEPVPLPPLDELSLPVYPETVQPLSYTEQYNYSYPVSGYNYYGQVVAEVPCTNYYASFDGTQVLQPQTQASQYYESAPTSYSETGTVIMDTVNTTKPLVYYDFPSESSGPVSYQEAAQSSLPGQVGVATDPMGNPKVEIVSSAISTTTVPITIEATPNVIALENITDSLTTSASIVSSDSSMANMKAQHKVVRSKKRTISAAPSLRSNKKVSSLVDKWKAAKEELHEDEEDEPENAYEMLEKKRQKEIEEWKAYQISSGEAKANANFQPLGGDWRERVKRKRTKLNKEALKAQKDIPKSEKWQPNLTELSRDLPSGWQAYWDESSKEVYYGNINTSETSWKKPT